MALSPESTKDADTLDEAATSASPEITETEAPSSSKRKAKPAAKKPKSTSARTEAAASRRGKSQAKSASASEPAAEVSVVSQDSAADEQPAQTPDRRGKLGLFKKTDDAQGGAPDEGAGVGPARDPVPAVTAAENPTKRKRSKRMARGSKASA